MEMQDVDYEFIYEPGKDGTDPMDYLSRPPRPQTERDDTEKVIKALVSNEHGIVMKSIREATSQDILKRMKQNDWGSHKNRQI